MLWDAKYFEPQCCHDHYSPLYGVVHDITRHCVYLMVAMSESVSRHCNNGRCYVHRNCKCFEAIVVTSLSLTQYTCRYMHNIIRPNTQQALSRPHRRGVGWKHKRRNWRRWSGHWWLRSGKWSALVGTLVGQRQIIS